ncbi:MAG: hypothetical protein FWH42_02300 [Dehalococcoidia bacterium]|nr:hypothetical protein [Dehalococcoidia bacterium]
MRKRLLSVFITVCLAIGFAAVYSPSTTAAAPSDFLAPIDLPEAGSTPISTRAELEDMANDLNGKYHLTADIDLSGVDWVPIGSLANPFKGVFDGQGHVITGMTITDSITYAGLFGYTNSATIKNVGMEDSSIDIHHMEASAAAFFGGIAGYCGGTVTNCYNTGDVNASSDVAEVYAGGIMGRSNNDVSIENCYNTGDVSASSGNGDVHAGGIIGRSNNGDSIENCYNTGDVSASSDGNGDVHAGGIIGCNEIGAIIIKNCYNTGDVSASADIGVVYAGGIAGNCDGTIANCYNTGDMTVVAYGVTSGTRARAGGIIGYSMYDTTITDCFNTGDLTVDFNSAGGSEGVMAGGIAGFCHGTIANCYNTGKVASNTISSRADAGGIVGFNQGTVTECFNTGKVTSNSVSGASFAGGIVGTNEKINGTEGTVINCYNTGNLDATGSLAGVGGIAGYNFGIIKYCYNTGNLAYNSGTKATYGGVVGLNDITITNCYWNVDSDQIVNGVPVASKQDIGDFGYGTAMTTSLTSSEMKVQANFVDFDFDTIWGIFPSINNGYPILQAFIPVITITTTTTITDTTIITVPTTITNTTITTVLITITDTTTITVPTTITNTTIITVPTTITNTTITTVPTTITNNATVTAPGVNSTVTRTQTSTSTVTVPASPTTTTTTITSNSTVTNNNTVTTTTTIASPQGDPGAPIGRTITVTDTATSTGESDSSSFPWWLVVLCAVLGIALIAAVIMYNRKS